MDIEAVKSKLQEYGQEHLLQFVDTLSEKEKEALLEDISRVDLDYVTKVFQQTSSGSHSLIKDELLEALSNDVHEGVRQCAKEKLQSYTNKGLETISNGEVAVILLAGGQGTRLGVKYPKGMYDVGLPSRKPLFQLQAERLRKLEKLANKHNSSSTSSITWYIMTSEQTKEATEDFFKKHDYFGIKESNIVLFEQGKLPCFTFDGKIILSKPNQIAFAPDGNGGLYTSLKRSGILDDMMKRNIKYVHVYSVDNILVKIADPAFIGYCIEKNCDSGAKVVEKLLPNEALGVICKVDGKYQVVEYSEISENISTMRNDHGRLTYSCGNICNHFFTVDFLRKMAEESLIHHVAKKKIPFVDTDGKIVSPTKPNGIKLEKFIFDVFQYAKHFVVWEAKREEDFSPLKNADGAESDTPTTARKDLMQLHLKYIQAAGGIIEGDSNEFICEISPLLSYDGEDLEDSVKSKKFNSPLLLSSKEEEGVNGEQNVLAKKALSTSDNISECNGLTSNGFHGKISS